MKIIEKVKVIYLIRQTAPNANKSRIFPILGFHKFPRLLNLNKSIISIVWLKNMSTISETSLLFNNAFQSQQNNTRAKSSGICPILIITTQCVIYSVYLSLTVSDDENILKVRIRRIEIYCKAKGTFFKVVFLIINWTSQAPLCNNLRKY